MFYLKAMIALTAAGLFLLLKTTSTTRGLRAFRQGTRTSAFGGGTVRQGRQAATSARRRLLRGGRPASRTAGLRGL